MADRNSKKSTGSSPERMRSWTAMIRISIARSLLRSARSLALWIAPELEHEEMSNPDE